MTILIRIRSHRTLTVPTDLEVRADFFELALAVVLSVTLNGTRSNVELMSTPHFTIFCTISPNFLPFCGCLLNSEDYKFSEKKKINFYKTFEKFTKVTWTAKLLCEVLILKCLT
jgi:hypothetical protein